jgi:alkanesulfonate monooxygenase SsuD/methylene tetrahydromethanopterin reductase-like flavin-dependent oxidoreductase (luciferase family)
MPCINIISADTDAEADYLSTSMLQMFMGVITGERKPMPPPVDDMSTVWSPQQKMMVQQMLACSFIGSKESELADLEAFIDQTGADELMVASYIYDFEQRLKSHRLIAEAVEV